jgi:hypothetical protein
VLAPIVAGAGKLLLGTALTGGAAWAGSALMPTLQKAMGNDVSWKLNDDPSDWGKDNERRVIQTDKQGNTTYRPLDNDTVKAFGGWQVVAARNKEHGMRLERLRKEQELKGMAERGQARQDFLVKLQAGKLALDQETQQAEINLGWRRTQVDEDNSKRVDATNRLDIQSRDRQAQTLADAAERKRLDDQVVNTNESRQRAYQNEVAAATAEHQSAVEAWRWDQENRSRPGQLLMLAGSRLMGGAS